MKQLQNNFTTPEQSRKLLELGVPADSADCAMFPYDETFKQYELRVVSFNKIFSTYEIYNEDGTIYTGKIPCWSVGRLIEIAHLCSGSTLSYKEEADELKKFKEAHKCETIIEAIIMCIEDACSIGGMDFSKLEE